MAGLAPLDPPIGWDGKEVGSSPLPNRLEGLGSVVSAPAGSGAEPLLKTDFSAFKRHRMLRVEMFVVN